MLIGLFPELDAPGGIQRAGRHIAFVMSEYAASKNWEYRFLSLNDTQELHRMRVGEREFVYTGSARSKWGYLSGALKAARREPRLIVAAHPNLGPIAETMKLVARGTPSVVCSHGVEVWEKLPRLRRQALQNAALALAPSKATAESLVLLQKVEESRVRVLPWGLDPDFETKLLGLAGVSVPDEFPRGRVILTVGRWVESERYKGMDTLIKAMPRLLLRWPDLALALVGAGDDQQWLVDIARHSGVQKHVHFLTGLTYAQLSACYAAAEIFALPSKGEGFGFVYLEAMARGKPVIAGAHGGAPEVVQDGFTGYVVQHDDTEQLATAINTLLASPELGREMGARGKERVDKEFRFSVFAKAFKKILRELCES